MSCRSRPWLQRPRAAGTEQPSGAKRCASSDPPARITGFVHVAEDTHFILVSVDEQLLQQRIAQIVSECLLQVLLGFLDGGEACAYLGARWKRQRGEALLQRAHQGGALTLVARITHVRSIEGGGRERWHGRSVRSGRGCGFPTRPGQQASPDPDTYRETCQHRGGREPA